MGSCHLRNWEVAIWDTCHLDSYPWVKAVGKVLICYNVKNIFILKCFRYEQEFIGQADEIRQKVVFRGNFDKDFKDFLKMKGF